MKEFYPESEREGERDRVRGCRCLREFESETVREKGVRESERERESMREGS